MAALKYCSGEVHTVCFSTTGFAAADGKCSNEKTSMYTTGSMKRATSMSYVDGCTGTWPTEKRLVPTPHNCPARKDHIF